RHAAQPLDESSPGQRRNGRIGAAPGAAPGGCLQRLVTRCLTPLRNRHAIARLSAPRRPHDARRIRFQGYTSETCMNSDSIDRSWRALPAVRLPLSGFMEERGQGVDNLLATLVRRITGGNLAYLGVPADLVYRLACLCSRWSPDLQEFIAQVLERSGNLDHFLTQPAAADHHGEMYGLLEASVTAAEFAMNADHDARSRKPLPVEVSELQQVCAAAAFLFDLGK